MSGEIDGIEEGTKFASRKELHNAGIHKGLMRGIAPKGYSIVLSGGYTDDEDYGDVIIYTGEGGRDYKTGRQEQELMPRPVILDQLANHIMDQIYQEMCCVFHPISMCSLTMVLLH